VTGRDRSGGVDRGDPTPNRPADAARVPDRSGGLDRTRSLRRAAATGAVAGSTEPPVSKSEHIARAFRRGAAAVVVLVLVAVIVLVERREAEVVDAGTEFQVDFAAFPQTPRPGRVSTSWFCPGIAAGDGVSAGSVSIANPDDSSVSVAIRLLTTEDSEQFTVEVGPRTTLVFDALRGRTVGVVVPVVEVIGGVALVEQQIAFGAGNTTSPCALGASPTWYFADGFTDQGSSERINIANPFPESAVVNMSFTTIEGQRKPPDLQGIIVPPRAVKSIKMSEVGAKEEPIISVSLEATRGKVVGSRSQHYLGGGRLGYSTYLGIPEPLDNWWFAGGNAGPQVTEELILYNPGDEEITVTAVFVGEGLNSGDVTTPEPVPSTTTVPPATGTATSTPAGTPTATPAGTPAGTPVAPAPPTTTVAPAPVDPYPVVALSVTVGAGDVVTLETGTAENLPRGRHGIAVSSADGRPFVVEHVISQRIAGKTFTAVIPGAPEKMVAEIWHVPSGLPASVPAVLTIVNTSAVAGTVSISAVGPGGEFALTGLSEVPIGPGGLLSIDTPPDTPSGQVIVRATVPLVVQRRLPRGGNLVGYSAALALPQLWRQ